MAKKELYNNKRKCVQLKKLFALQLSFSIHHLVSCILC